MQPPRGLETLFAALREAKILVGPREVLRAHEVLSRAENLDRDGLRSLLAAVLVKSREERQRFDEIFREFAQAQDATAPLMIDERLSKIQAPPPTNVEPIDKPDIVPPIKPCLSRRTVLYAVGVLAALVGGAFIATRWATKETVVVSADAGVIADAALDTSIATSSLDAAPEPRSAEEMYPDAQDMAHPSGDEQLPNQVAIAIEAPRVARDERTFTTLVARIAIEQKYFATSSSGLIAGLGILSIVLSVGAWFVVRRRKILPPKAPAPTRSGPRELPLSAPVARDLELLDIRSEDALVWGVGKFVTDDITTSLDIERSVLATVSAGGRPELRFERRGRHRTVCIWIDESAKDPTIERFGRELSLALSRVGLDVEVARYWAVPDKLVRSDGSVFSPASLEEELAFAIIAIMTDGQALSMRHAGADRKLGISKLFRILSRLPRLAFVDFGEGPSRASRIAGAYGMTAVRPDEAAEFLAMGRKPETRDGPSRKLSGDVMAWAAACAFAMHPIDEETAYDIRRVLGLSVSPWAWAAIRRSGRAMGDLVDWSQQKRVQLLDWLRRSEHGIEGVRVDSTSLLGKTISYWKNRIDAEAAARTKDDAQTPWIGTPAERALRIERAFVDLWDQPEDAARFLYSFVGTDAESGVKEKLRDVGPLEAEGLPDTIVLPWRFDDLPDATRSMLERLGFGGAAWRRAGTREGDLVERRGRMWAGLGLACGVGFGAIVAGINSWQTQTFPCVVKNVEDGGGWCEEVAGEAGRRQVLGGLAGFWSELTAERTEQPTVVFDERQVPCAEVNKHDWLIMRCGQDVPPAKPKRMGGPRRSVYMVFGDPQDERVVAMARHVLSRNAADVVVTTKVPLRGDFGEWFPRFDPEGHDRWVIFREKGASPSTPYSPSKPLQVFQYELPRRTRVVGVPAKPKQVWWSAFGDRSVVLTVDDKVTEIDSDGNGFERNLIEPPSVGPAKSVVPLSGQSTRIGEPGMTFPNLTGELSWMAWSPNGTAVVFASRQDSVEVATFGEKNTRQGLSSLAGKLAGPAVWNFMGNRIAAVAQTGSIVTWYSGIYAATEFNLTIPMKPTSLVWSVNGQTMIIGTETGVKTIVDNGLVISQSITDLPVSKIVGPIASKYLVSSAKAGKLFLVSSTQSMEGAPTFEVLREIRALAGSISPDGRLIATVHEGSKIRVTTPDDIAVNEIECDTKEAPAWSPDGKRLLAICGDKVVDTAVFPAMFSIRTLDGKCVSQDELVKYLGLRTSEARFILETCEPDIKP